jgi:hypothetical protein
MAKGDFWTEEETARGRELSARSVSADEFFQLMGRSKGSFFSHCRQTSSAICGNGWSGR